MDLLPRKFFEEKMPNDIASTHARPAAETIQQLSFKVAQQGREDFRVIAQNAKKADKRFAAFIRLPSFVIRDLKTKKPRATPIRKHTTCFLL